MLYVVTYTLKGFSGYQSRMVEADTGIDARLKLQREFPGAVPVSAIKHGSSKGMPVGKKTTGSAFRSVR